MPVDASPLRDRMVFVEGAPRSGTTLLTMLLAAHPEIAGITGETHLFDAGVGEVFDNFEAPGEWRAQLAAFVTRAELVAAVRALADSVLVAMREKTKPAARFVIEKTPTPADGAELALRRKLECYPDGWFVHIVRDPVAVSKSLQHAPWNPVPGLLPAERWARECVAAVRAVLGGQDRYREIRYEELVEAPRSSADEIFGWLGLDADSELLDRIAILARHRVSQNAPAPTRTHVDRTGSERPAAPSEPSGSRRFGRRIGIRLRRHQTSAAASVRSTLERFSAALRDSDHRALAELCVDDVTVALRSGDGDNDCKGNAAVSFLGDISQAIFGDGFMSETWSVATGDPVHHISFSGIRHSGARVDLAIPIRADSAGIRDVVIISAGPLEGRPLRDLAMGEE